MKETYLTLWKKVTQSGQLPISYSQIRKFSNCPLSYKLDYIDKIKVFDTNIHLVYGNAMHSSVYQFYEHQKNNGNVTTFNPSEVVYKHLINEFNNTKDKSKISKSDIIEYLKYGADSLTNFKEAYNNYIDLSKYSLVDNEIPLNIKYIHSKLNLIGFVDMVFKSNSDYLLIDVKTATKPWTDTKANDITTSGQLLMYKYMYAKQHNVSPKNIKIAFLVFSRTKIQIIYPNVSNEVIAIRNFISNFTKFVFPNVNVSHDFNTTSIYRKTQQQWNCTFCAYKGSKYCDKHPLDSNHVLNKQK